MTAFCRLEEVDQLSVDVNLGDVHCHFHADKSIAKDLTLWTKTIRTISMNNGRNQYGKDNIKECKLTSLRQPLKLVAFLRCHSFSACSPVCSDTPARYIDLCT